MPRSFCSLLQAIRNAKFAIVENRHKKYKFGCNNYGEFFGKRFRNKADGDNWDIVCPGYSELPCQKYKVKNVEGVILLSNGNHKIVVDLVSPFKRSSKLKQLKEIKRYMKNYTNFTKVPTFYLKF